MVGKTFKGMTDELLAWQTEELQRRQVRATKHVVYVRPELSSSWSPSTGSDLARYPAGWRSGSPASADTAPTRTHEADTIDTVRAMAGLPPRQ